MEALLKTISTLFDHLYIEFIGPLFTLLVQGLDAVILRPLQFVHLPAILQVIVVGILTALLSVWIRRRMKVDAKEAAFRAAFLAQKAQQDDLKLISDWKSREAYAKVIDDDIDQDFNSYLAERFARYGLIYLLPIFLTLSWLQNAIVPGGVLLPLGENQFNIQGISVNLVFLVTYCSFLIGYFRLRKKVTKPT
jgi:membrane protein implicated in regulation of membrane protease activity